LRQELVKSSLHKGKNIASIEVSGFREGARRKDPGKEKENERCLRRSRAQKNSPVRAKKRIEIVHVGRKKEDGREKVIRMPNSPDSRGWASTAL